jgi:hypothetical protein
MFAKYSTSGGNLALPILLSRIPVGYSNLSLCFLDALYSAFALASVLHYAVLIGYDEEKDIFTLADPYGFNKTIGKDDFFEAISFRNDCLSEFIKKTMPSNAMIRFSKRT